MLLRDHEHGICLRPLRYQFPTVSGDPHDDNWLVVEGEVTTARGGWSFTDPCLLTGEARELSSWLRAVAGMRADAPSELSFLEPVVSFSLVDWRHDTGSIGVHLSHGAAPPSWEVGAGAHSIVIDTTAERLREAADEWDRHLARFPAR